MRSTPMGIQPMVLDDDDDCDGLDFNNDLQ